MSEITCAECGAASPDDLRHGWIRICADGTLCGRDASCGLPEPTVVVPRVGDAYLCCEACLLLLAWREAAEYVLACDAVARRAWAG